MQGFLFEWPKEYSVQAGYPPQEVRRYCVLHSAWQRTRLSMKGKPTHEKLAILKAWWDREKSEGYITEVQVGNYLGALRRGGQLDDRNQIRKYI